MRGVKTAAHPWLLLMLATLSFAQTTPPQPGATPGGEDSLAQQAADPTAPLMAFNMKEEYSPALYGVPGSNSDFLFQPVIPFVAWGVPNLLRATVNYNTSGFAGTGLNNVSIFDLIVFNEKWGRWGFGPLVQFVPNSGPGRDTALAGPAHGLCCEEREVEPGRVQSESVWREHPVFKLPADHRLRVGQGLDIGIGRCAVEHRLDQAGVGLHSPRFAARQGREAWPAAGPVLR